MDIQRLIPQWFASPARTPVSAPNATLVAANDRKEAASRFASKDRDGRDDLLLRDRNNGNHYVLSADHIDFTAVGIGNRLAVDGIEAEVLDVNNESALRATRTGPGGAVALTRKVADGWFGSRQVPVALANAEVRAITSPADRKALENRVYRDGKDNLVIQDDRSRNTFLVTADAIDFRTIGRDDRVTIGHTTGRVTRIDDEQPRATASAVDGLHYK